MAQITRRAVKRRSLLQMAGLALGSSVVSRRGWGAEGPKRPPNIILVFADDLGYQDLGCFGAPAIRTPRIDQLARQGRRFTSFYAQTVCGPSRAALMTGCYPLRVATKGNRVEVHPRLHTREVTIAEVLKQAGYATAAFGKWDLAGHSQTGFEPDLLPAHQGFDTFFGTPTSNDRIVNLYRDTTLVEKQADMNTLTRRYTDAAIAFIREHRVQPFFVYLPHTMPHTRLGVSPAFRGKSERGLYGDVVEEIDAEMGRLVDTVKELGLVPNTYVIFTSDNGPWAIRGANGGSALPLRGAKTSSWEGGLRVPFVIWAPGRVPAGTSCDEVATTMDMLPTFAALAGVDPPADRIIDGHDIRPLIHGDPGAVSPTDAFFYYVHTHLQAVRSGRWKLHVPRDIDSPWGPKWSGHIAAADRLRITKPMLFDLDTDIGEQHDVAADHPDVVARLMTFVERARTDIGDYNRVGRGARFFDPGPHRPDIGKWRSNESKGAAAGGAAHRQGRKKR